MQISVVIPTYHAARFLPATLRSVVGQTHTQWELIVVDDGSRDDTVQIAQEWAARDPRIRMLCQANAGVAAARNRGLQETSPASEAVIFLDHDDLWRADALEVLAAALNTDPQAVGAHALALLVQGERGPDAVFQPNGDAAVMQWRRRKMVRTLGVTRTVDCARTEPTTFNVQVYDGCIPTPGVMLARRATLLQAGPFDAAMVPCDDWDMWVRLSLLGPTVFVDDALLNWCVYGGNASLNQETMGRGVSQMRRKMFTLPGQTQEQRHLAHTRYRRTYASVERHNARDYAHDAASAMRAGDAGRAARLWAQAVVRCARYLRLVLWWGSPLDKGPLPARLHDTGRPLGADVLSSAIST